jgi:hypothetical protein
MFTLPKKQPLTGKNIFRKMSCIPNFMAKFDAGLFENAVSSVFL